MYVHVCPAISSIQYCFDFRSMRRIVHAYKNYKHICFRHRNKLFTMDRIVSYDVIANMKNTPDVYLIEIREKHELNETGTIPFSIHIPQGEVGNELSSLDEAAFQSKYNISKPKLYSPIIFTCRSGRRAEKAMYDLEKMGYTNCKYYAGSWLEWESRQQ